MTKPCLVQHWKQAAVVRGLPGLRMGRHGFSLDPTLFACCDGRGMRLTAEETLSRCSLTQRIQRVQRLSGDWQRSWGQQGLPMQRLMEQVDQLEALELRDLADRMLGEAGHPVSGRWSQKSTEPSPWWAAALKMGWIEGRSIAVQRFDRGCPDTPASVSVPAGATAPELWVLECVDQVWEPARAERLERWLTWADDHQQKLWLELTPPVKKKPNARAGMFAAKIAAAQETAMFDELSSRARDLLRRAGLEKPPRSAGEGARSSKGELRP